MTATSLIPTDQAPADTMDVSAAATLTVDEVLTGLDTGAHSSAHRRTLRAPARRSEIAESGRPAS